MADSAATLVKRVYDAYLAGDLETAHAQFAEDAVGYDHGTNARAGTYAGKSAVVEQTMKISGLTNGTLTTVVKEVLDGGDYAAVVETATATREGRELDVDVCTLYRARDGKLVEYHILPLDQAAWDRFWA
jgi:ketosteroid isomerase-like protein